MMKLRLEIENGFGRRGQHVSLEILEDKDVLARILASQQRLEDIMDDVVASNFGDLVLEMLAGAEARAAARKKAEEQWRGAVAAETCGD